VQQEIFHVKAVVGRTAGHVVLIEKERRDSLEKIGYLGTRRGPDVGDWRRRSGERIQTLVLGEEQRSGAKTGRELCTHRSISKRGLGSGELR